MTRWYAACAEGAYDAATDVCSEAVYVDSVPSAFPELSREEGALLGGALFYLLFTAWVFRVLRKRRFT